MVCLQEFYPNLKTAIPTQGILANVHNTFSLKSYLTWFIALAYSGSGTVDLILLLWCVCIHTHKLLIYRQRLCNKYYWTWWHTKCYTVELLIGMIKEGHLRQQILHIVFISRLCSIKNTCIIHLTWYLIHKVTVKSI